MTGVRWDESTRRKLSHGEVTFMDKKTQKLAEKELSDGDFFSTPQGGVVLRLDNRENARIVEMCYKTHTTTINPIVDWTTEEVWEFIHEHNLPYCCLYDEGFKRLGCIGCPMGRRKNRELEFERWPKYKTLYLKAFERMIAESRGWVTQEKPRRAGSNGTSPVRIENMTPEQVMEWWID